MPIKKDDPIYNFKVDLDTCNLDAEYKNLVSMVISFCKFSPAEIQSRLLSISNVNVEIVMLYERLRELRNSVDHHLSEVVAYKINMVKSGKLNGRIPGTQKEVDIAIDGDADVITIKKVSDNLENQMSTLDKLSYDVKNLGHHIRNYIDYQKFLNGER